MLRQDVLIEGKTVDQTTVKLIFQGNLFFGKANTLGLGACMQFHAF